MTYRRRSGALPRGEREWRVEPDALIASSGGRSRRYRWSDIVSVRLYADPARGRPWRYVFELQPRHDRKIEIDNANFVGDGAYEDQSEAYTAFVRAATAALARANPKARALIAETPKRFFFLTLTALIAFGALAYALIALRTPIDGWSYAAPIKFGVILLMLPVFWGLVVRAVPRGFPLDAIPDRALPPGSQNVNATTEANSGQ
ncbi:MAG: hypothetical protein AB7O98_12795 [Hyphomonadaceae bacterium]